MKSRWAAVLLVVLIVGLLAVAAVLGYRIIQERQVISSPTNSPTPTTLIPASLPTATSGTTPTAPQGAVIIPTQPRS
jgi:hypothetical protein